MSEREKALKELRAAGIIGALEWAAGSAQDRAFRDFDPATGHDRALLGYTVHTLLRDRQDRVFRCKDYAQPLEQEAALSDEDDQPDEPAVDTLLVGLTDRDIDEMPRELGGTAVRSDLNGSPGWRYGRIQWFTAAYPYGGVDKIRWSEMSPTKQRIAARLGSNSADQLVMPSEMLADGEAFQTLAEVLAQGRAEHVLYLMLAHAIDQHTGFSELYIGHPRLSPDGGPCWLWREPLKGRGEDPFGQRLHGPAPRPQDPDSVSDAPVRLRPSAADNGAKRDIKGL